MGVTPKPNSVCASDDQASNPLQLDQFIGYCLLQSIDAARISSFVVDGQGPGETELPIMGLYPLLRAQIECASLAAWVMTPSTRRERILRRLQASHDEFRYEKMFVEAGLELGKKTNSYKEKVRREISRQAREQKRYLEAIADANGIAKHEYEEALPGLGDMANEAGRWLGLGSAAKVAWMLSSGFTHASFRRGLRVLDLSVSATHGNIHEGVMTTNNTYLHAGLEVVYRTTLVTLKRWGHRRIAIDGERPVPTPLL